MQTTIVQSKDTGSYLNAANIPDLEAVKARQKAAWESGDFGRIAHTIETAAGEFMARQPLHAGAQVLDVAAARETSPSLPPATAAQSGAST